MTLGKKVWSYNIRRAQEKKYLWWVLDEDNGANTKNAFRILTEQAQQNIALNPTSFEVTFLPFDENIVGGRHYRILMDQMQKPLIHYL